MDTIQQVNYLHILGYVAAGLVIISFLYKPQHRVMRLINAVGCFLFVLYGTTLNNGDGLPIIIANATILFIHIIYYFNAKKNITNHQTPSSKNTN